jgi:hypothetical protein
MNNGSNDLLLKILLSEIETVILNSKKIQSRLREISKLGILENIAHQNFGANLGELAEAILEGVDIKDSFPQRQQKQDSSGNNSLSELQKWSQQAPYEEDSECGGNPCPGKNTHDGIEGEKNSRYQQIDGMKLSLQEIRFQEYLEKQFSEGKWLTKAKIEYPGETAELG